MNDMNGVSKNPIRPTKSGEPMMDLSPVSAESSWWRKRGWMIATIVLAVVLVLSWLFGVQVDVQSRRYGWSTGGSSTSLNGLTDGSLNDEVAPLTIDDYVVSDGAEAKVDDDPSLGDVDAPLTIVEYTDYDCPFCQAFVETVLPDLKAQYIDTGKIRLVVRDFPIDSLHPNARTKAEASECAEDQGKFFEFHDRLFGKETVAVADLADIAEELGMNRDEFKQCVDDRVHKDEVENDIADGEAAGITGTPGFVVGGNVLAGAPQPELLFPFLDALLEGQE